MRYPALVAVSMAALAAIALAGSGCAARCYATPDKLAHLRRAMTYAEVVDVMGCTARPLSQRGPDSGDYSSLEWDGPDQIFFQRTQLDFLGGRLLSYTTGRRSAL